MPGVGSARCGVCPVRELPVISPGEPWGFRACSSRVGLGGGAWQGLAVAWLSRSLRSCPAPRGSSRSPVEKGELGCGAASGSA